MDVELLNGVDGENGRRVTRDPGAVDDGLSRIRLAVEEAFYKVSVILGA